MSSHLLSDTVERQLPPQTQQCIGTLHDPDSIILEDFKFPSTLTTSLRMSKTASSGLPFAHSRHAASLVQTICAPWSLGIGFWYDASSALIVYASTGGMTRIEREMQQ